MTHLTKGLLAGDIIRGGKIEPTDCDVLNESLAFFFYGRPAYRTHGEDVISSAATCPFCFIFDPSTIHRANEIHALDTGAFARRLYSHVLMDEISAGDFSLEREIERPNKLIAATFGSRAAYLDGDKASISEADSISRPGDFLARAYIDLIRSAGRNEPDDRVCTIEVTTEDSVPLSGNLMAVVVPDIL